MPNSQMMRLLDGLRQDYEIEVLDYGFKQIVVCIKTSDGLQIVRQVDF